MSRIAVNGVRLNVEVSGQGPALLLLHGFTGSGKTWTGHVESWRTHTCIAVDLLGHGASDCPAGPERYRMERCVEDLTALLDELGVGRAAVLGYSMGARVALHLALAAPERLSALVLESASPGIDDIAERERRIASDEALARRIELDGVEAFVAEWEALPLFASQARLPEAARLALRRQRLANSPGGLANSLRGMGAGAQACLSPRLDEVRAPVLLLAGASDEKYVALARGMASTMACAQLEIVPGAGHAIHLEQPDLFGATVHSFLERTSRHEVRQEEQ